MWGATIRCRAASPRRALPFRRPSNSRSSLAPSSRSPTIIFQIYDHRYGYATRRQCIAGGGAGLWTEEGTGVGWPRTTGRGARGAQGATDGREVRGELRESRRKRGGWNRRRGGGESGEEGQREGKALRRWLADREAGVIESAARRGTCRASWPLSRDLVAPPSIQSEGSAPLDWTVWVGAPVGASFGWVWSRPLLFLGHVNEIMHVHYSMYCTHSTICTILCSHTSGLGARCSSNLWYLPRACAAFKLLEQARPPDRAPTPARPYAATAAGSVAATAL